MPNIQINIKDKVARADRAIIVCDNSDYTAVFDFDDEWSAYETKTARFVYGGTYTDVVFTGNSCPIPEIHDSRSLSVGVYAGDLHTTTPAYISCVPSILCGNGIPADPTPEVYAQIMELLNKESGIWYPAVDDAGNMSWTRSISETEPQPVNIKGPKGDAGASGADGKDGISPAVSVAAITGGNRITITDAEGAKTFDVMDGAQGASGADGKDYVLTNTDKQEIAKTAAGLVDVPSVQPDWNQNDLTQPDYVKNRPFYMGDPVETVLVEEITVPFADAGGIYMTQSSSAFAATVGETYKVYWDGTAYECTCVSFEDIPVIGNLSIMGAGSDTGEPFFMVARNVGGIEIYTADASDTHTFSISGRQTQIVKIPAKYIDKNASGYIVVHNSSTMTEEEAKNYRSAISKGEAVFIIWESLYISKISVQTESDSTGVSVVYLYVDTPNGELYKIAQNSEGLFKLGDRRLSQAYFPVYKSTGEKIPNIRIKDNRLNIIPSTSSNGAGTTDILFSVHTNGTKSKAFNVLGNGEAVAPALILYSSTANSTKKFRITVDDSGAPTITNESDSTNTWKPTNLPTVTASDTGKFLRVSDTGEWVAETILSASGVSF